MENIVLETRGGYIFDGVAKKAKLMADDFFSLHSLNKNVEFEFNNIKCLVSKSTNLDFLKRDYLNASIMGWEKVGPDCVEQYSSQVKAQLQKKKEQREIESAIQAEQWKKEEEAKQSLLNSKIAEIEFDCINTQALKAWEDANSSDGYGLAIINYAKTWGKLMQFEIAEGKNLIDIANKTSHEADTEGITGFMYGASVRILSDCWVHGKELSKWHNKKYGHTGEGVVNPAIITISN